MEWSLEAERDLWRDICTPGYHPHSFYWFVRIAMGVEFYMMDQPQDNWFTQEFHQPVCDWLDFHINNWARARRAGIKRRVKLALLMPRFTGKSFIATKSSTLYMALVDPDISTFIGSEIAKKASGWLESIKEVIKGVDGYSWFSWLYGNWYDSDRRWTKAEVNHAYRKNLSRTEPSFGIWGIETGITGYHPDAGWMDDPLSEDKIKENGSWVSTVNTAIRALRPAFRTDSFLGIAFTRKRDNDVAGNVVFEEGVRSWSGHPCPDIGVEIRKDGEWDVYFMQARDPETRESVHPLWPTSELDAYESNSPYEFASEMMNQPGSGDHMALTSTQIDQCYINPADLPTQMRYSLHMDTAFKRPENIGKGDESVILIFGHDPRGNGDVYFIEGYGSKTWTHDEFTRELVLILQRYNKEGKHIACMTDELEGWGKVGLWKSHLTNAAHDVKLRLPRFIMLPRGNKQKTPRMIEAAAFWAEGHVKIVRGAPGARRLVEQMLKIGISKQDDWADAAADVFANEVYRPMLIRSRSSDNYLAPVRAGDEIIRSGAYPRNTQELRNFYDHEARPDLVEDSWSLI